MGIKPLSVLCRSGGGHRHFRTEVYRKEICKDLCGATTGFPSGICGDAQAAAKSVDLGFSDESARKEKVELHSPIGLGKVYVNDPIEK
jgi:hypothetical protein